MLVVRRMELDHAHAAMIADTINTEGGGRVLVRRVDTNLVIAWVDPALASPDQVVAALAEGEVKYLQYLHYLHYLLSTLSTQVRVLGLTFTKDQFRLAFHCDVTRDMALAARDKVAAVIRNLRQ